MKKINKMLVLVVVLMTAAVAVVSSNYNASKENLEMAKKLQMYKEYYNRAEALFDEIEEYDDSYFDSDAAADYLHIRSMIIRSAKNK